MTTKFFSAWLSSRRYFLLCLTSLLMMIALFGYLFGAEQTILFYQLGLFILISAIFLAFDLKQEYAEYRDIISERQVSGNHLSASEQLLTERLANSQSSYRNLQLAERQRREELLDYFTLWAHQIKIPLTASKLLVGELLDKQGLDQELFKIEQYADLAMSYLRLESFHDDLVLERQHLQDLVRASVKKYALFFIQQNIKLDLEDFDQTIVTDKKWFAIILEQILSNSLKYTKKGTISIRVQGDHLLIEDTGIGIQPDDLGRVFERGFSGYNGRLNQQSSGLGLYLSKTIAEKLGHSLTLTSEVGVGTKVAIGIKQADLRED